MPSMRTRCRCWRWPVVRRYVVRFFFLKTRIFGPFTSPTSEAVTAAPSSAGLPCSVPSSLAIISTRSKRTAPPSPGAARSSISITSPGATRYCLPPLSITAYIGRLLEASKTRGLRTLAWRRLAVNRRERQGRNCYPAVMLARLFILLTSLYLRLLGARRARLRKGEVALVYYDIGRRQGEPWLLLHGLGSVAATWSPVMRRLRRSCRMLVPELSALGGSECPGGGLGVKAGVESLTELIERELGDRPFTLAGISLGGWMAVRLALAHPERISRLVLIDAGGYRD